MIASFIKKNLERLFDEQWIRGGAQGVPIDLISPHDPLHMGKDAYIAAVADVGVFPLDMIDLTD